MPDILTTLRTLRQSRRFDGSPIDPDDLRTILEIARWTGSARNDQPWQLVVVDDRELLARLAHVRELNAWVEGAACAIVIVFPDGVGVTTPYDEGRLSERVMLAADALGYGSGTAWYTEDEHFVAVKELLGVPQEAHLLSLIAIGRVSDGPAGPPRRPGGRKPLEEIVSYNAFGRRER